MKKIIMIAGLAMSISCSKTQKCEEEKVQSLLTKHLNENKYQIIDDYNQEEDLVYLSTKGKYDLDDVKTLSDLKDTKFCTCEATISQIASDSVVGLSGKINYSIQTNNNSEQTIKINNLSSFKMKRP